MSVPTGPTTASTGNSGAPERALAAVEVAAMAALGALLIAGYVLLAAFGKDTTGYVLFLGGPAMTGLVGAVLSRRVRHVQTAVTVVQQEAAVALDAEAGAIHQHLAAQDKQLDALASAVVSPTDDPGGSVPTVSALAATLPTDRPSVPGQRLRDALSPVWPVAESGRRPGG